MSSHSDWFLRAALLKEWGVGYGLEGFHSPISQRRPTAPETFLPASEKLAAISSDLEGCERCPLHQGRKHIVFGVGNAKADLFFIGEGPGAKEDEEGIPFVGRAGTLLTKIIEKGMKISRSQVYIANIVKCRPPGNRNPQPEEIASCLPFLRRQIQAIRPKILITLGACATHSLLQVNTPISRLRGRFTSYDDIPLMPTFHPSYLLRNPSAKREVWEDIQRVMGKLNEG